MNQVQHYKRILTPVDGSEAAEKALQTATEIAKRNNAHLDMMLEIRLDS